LVVAGSVTLLAVLVEVGLCGFISEVVRMKVMTGCQVRVMTGLFVGSRLVMFCGFPVMVGSVLEVLCSLLVMLCGLLGH
jgi:hypothetical protein